MAYLFGAGVTDKIDCGTGVGKANTWSLAIRFKATSAATTDRFLAAFAGASGVLSATRFNTGGTNVADGLFSKSVGTVFVTTPSWTSGFTAGSIHTLVLTYNQTRISLFADSDATEKVGFNETGVPDQGALMNFIIGNAGDTRSADATIYEVAWYAGVVLTGAQAAVLGAGGQVSSTFPAPTDYWPLISDAVALIGGHDGTVTGATVVAHSGTNWFPAADPAPAYVFGTSGDAIDCGTGVAHASTFSVAVRYKPASSNSTDRFLAEFTGSGGAQANMFLHLSGSLTNAPLVGFSKAAGTAYPFACWEAAALAAGTIVTLIGTYDGANLKLYAGTDATPKVTVAETGTPDQGTQNFRFGHPGSASADGTIYETAWWAGTVLTGAQAALIGAGGPVSGVPLPDHYWPFQTDATDFYGAADGTVTGTTPGTLVGTPWFGSAGSPAYTFGAANTDNIDAGFYITHANRWTLAARFTPTALGAGRQYLASFANASGVLHMNAALFIDSTGVHASFGQAGGGGSEVVCTWTTSLTPGTQYRVLAVYNQTNIRIFADVDATAKATQAATAVPTQEDDQHFVIGNILGGSLSADAVIHEVAWWPGVVLTGAQAALLGVTGPATGVPRPWHYWPLNVDHKDLYQEDHATITGMTSSTPVGTPWFVAITPVTPVTFTVGAPATFVSAATLAGLGSWFWPDSGIMALNNGGGTYAFFAGVGGGGHAGRPGKLVGTIANPLSVSSLETSISPRLDAPDGTVAQTTYQGGGSIYKDPASGMLILFSHQEHVLGSGSFGGTQYYAWIGVLKSTDGGDTWADCGAIITPYHSFAEMDALWASFGKADGTQYNADIGWAPYIIVDGYFYVYSFHVDGPIVADNPYRGGGGVNIGGVFVSRAPVADVVAAAASGTVSDWFKYAGDGQWTEPGIHGRGLAVTPVHVYSFAISYNTFRNKYIIMLAHEDTVGDSPDQKTFGYLESTDGIHWTDPQLLAIDLGRLPFHLYNSMLDPASFTPSQTGRTFYFIGKNLDTLDVERFAVTLTGAGSSDTDLLTVLHPAGGSRGD